MKYYCINLKDRTDKREHAESEFAKLGIEVEIVEAVDGVKQAIREEVRTCRTG